MSMRGHESAAVSDREAFRGSSRQGRRRSDERESGSRERGRGQEARPRYRSPSPHNHKSGDTDDADAQRSRHWFPPSRHHDPVGHGGFGGQERPSYKDRSRERDGKEDAASADALGLEDKRRMLSEGRNRDERGQSALPDLYSIQKGKVRSIRPYGVFVNLYNYRSNGLVHLSQISNHEITKKDDSDELKVQAISSVVEEGDEVWVKVISVKHEEDGSVKVGCSLKYVSQSDGRDLDPNNVQHEQQQSRPTWQAPQKLVLDAVYNVTCTRCGGHGHLKKECYSTGERVYELLTEDDAAEIHELQLLKETNQGRTGATPFSRQDAGTGRFQQIVKPADEVAADHVPRLKKMHSSKSTKKSHLPDKVTTVEEALAVIANLEDEKRREKQKRKQKKEKRHQQREEKKHKKRKKYDD
ncbi:hypothetical protein O6H91_Y301400 [Diphasiastrum complanatum]|nr:hypothetical protein O6H91_Y301400 [Diphasiastrum complanatum]